MGSAASTTYGGGRSGTGGTSSSNWPRAGNPTGACSSVPADAKADDSSTPDHVVGTGAAASCTSAAFVNAVAQGDVIIFDW